MYGGICFELRGVVSAIFFIFPCNQGGRIKIRNRGEHLRGSPMVLFLEKKFLG